jgi:hypothetical protein
VVVAVIALALLAAPVQAASGIHPISPREEAVPRGEAPTFRMRVNGKGAVYVRVCRSARRTNRAICDDEALGRAQRRAGGIATFRPKLYDFPEYFANRAGRYYWQAVRIACQGSDCRQEGPVVRFTVQ